MLPPPMRPMWKVMLHSESMIRRHEVFVGGFGGFRGGNGRGDQDAVAEGSGGAGGQGEIQRLLAFAKDFLSEGIGGEQAVTAGVPVGGKAGIGGVIENWDGDGFATGRAPEIGPAAPRAPNRDAP